MKNFLLLITAILLSIPGFTQDVGRTTIGAKGGLNLTNIGGGETDNALKPGGHIGVFTEFYSYEDWDFAAEFLLSSQGHAPKTDLDNKLRLMYFNIPVLFRYFPAEHVNLHAGPQLGILLSAKSKYEDQTSDVKEFFKTIDLGLALGGGYEFEVSGRRLNANLRYIYGLTNLSDGGSSRFNRVLQFSLGIVIIENEG